MAAKYIASKTLQCWPGGAGYTYRGDVDGPADKRRLRKAYGGKEARWRKGTAAEWRQIKIEELAQMYQNRDILANQSGIVSDLMREDHEGFQIDDLVNLYPDASDWDADRCRGWLDDRGIDAPEKPSDPDADEDDSSRGYLTELRDAVRENAEAAEVYEWYLVSSWLCDQLREIGEVVIDNGYGHYWGRTCTGQALIMDGTLQQIAASFVDRQ